MGFMWLFIAQAVYYAAQWLLLIIVTRRFGLAEFGRLALALSVFGPLLLLAGMQLRSVLLSDVDAERRFPTYLALRVLLTVVVFVGVSVVGSISVPTSGVIFVAVGGMRCCEAISDLCYGLFQRRHAYRHVGLALMLRGILITLCGGIIALIGGTVEHVLWAGFAVAAIGMTRDLMRTRPRAGQMPWPDILRLAASAAPLGAVAFLLSLSTTLPTYVLQHARSQAEVGAYSALMSFIIVGSTAIMAAGQVAAPSLARYVHAGARDRFGQLMLGLLAFAVTIGAIGVIVAQVAGTWILAVTYGEALTPYVRLMELAMIAGVAAYTAAMLRQGMIALGLHRRQLATLVAATVVLVGATWTWAPEYGVKGAVMATLAALVTQVVMLSAACIHGMRELTTLTLCD